MSLGSMIASSVTGYGNAPSGKVAVDMNLNRIGGIPGFFYSVFLKPEGRDIKIRQASQKILNEAIPLVQDPELKREMYKSLRERCFDRSDRSVIATEIVVLCTLGYNLINYGLMTLKMHIDT